MTNYFSRARRSRGAYYDALLADQANAVSVDIEELRDFDAAAQEEAPGHVLVVADQPAPARGYALLIPPTGNVVAARAHVIDGQPDEVYRSLFSHVYVQAARLTGNHPETTILVDHEVASPSLVDALARFGKTYAIRLATDDDILDAIVEEVEIEIDLDKDGITAESRDGEHAILLMLGDGSDPQVVYVQDGDTFTEPSAPEREGFILAGWAVASIPDDIEVIDGENAELLEWGGVDFDAPVHERRVVAAVWHEAVTTPVAPQGSPWDDPTPVGATSDSPEGDNAREEGAQGGDATKEADPEEVEKPAERLQCPDCDNDYASADALRRHAKQKHASK